MSWAFEYRRAGRMVAVGVNGRWIEVEIHRHRVAIALEWRCTIAEAERLTAEAAQD